MGRYSRKNSKEWACNIKVQDGLQKEEEEEEEEEEGEEEEEEEEVRKTGLSLIKQRKRKKSRNILYVPLSTCTSMVYALSVNPE